MTITLSGISSGLDTASIVTSLVAAESAPLTAMETSQTNLDGAATTLQSFASALSTLRNAAQTLADPSQFASYTATASSGAIVPSANFGTPVQALTTFK